MSENINQPREWRGSRAQIWISAACTTFFAGFLIFVTLSVFSPRWDPNHEIPDSTQFALLLVSYGLFGFMLLWSCWLGWAGLLARLRLDEHGVEFQDGLQLRRLRFADVRKVSWRPRWKIVTFTDATKRTRLNLEFYTPADRREIAAALHQTLAGCEQEGWEAFAAVLRSGRPPPVSLPRSERILFRWGGGVLAVSIIAAAGLLWAPNRLELRRGFYILEVFCAGGGIALVLVAIRELIYYQRTRKIFAGLVLALTACAVAVVTIAYAISTQLIHLRPH